MGENISREDRPGGAPSGFPGHEDEPRPVAVIAPGEFLAWCALCGMEIHTTAGWHSHLAGPEHQVRTQCAVDHMGEQLDKLLTDMERNAIQSYELVRQLQALRGASLRQMVRTGGPDGKTSGD